MTAEQFNTLIDYINVKVAYAVHHLDDDGVVAMALREARNECVTEESNQ